MMATTFDVIENRLSHKDQTDKTTFLSSICIQGVRYVYVVFKVCARRTPYVKYLKPWCAMIARLIKFMACVGVCACDRTPFM